MKKMLLVCCMVLLAFTMGSALGEGMIPIDLNALDAGEAHDSWQATSAGVRISAPGEYLISGTLKGGQIWVECVERGKVTLYLNGVEIENPTGPAIQIESSSPRAVISLVENSRNVLSNGENLVLDSEEEPDGVIFSRSDLTVEGSGLLEIRAGAMSGIVSRDDLVIEGGTLDIEAPKHGIKGRDFVRVSGGSVTIRAGRDGIKSTNKKSPELGYLEISGGEISIRCGDEALSYITDCHVTGGTMHLTMDQE